MKMLRVIIADDENKIRLALRRLIHWEELGLELACECSDGDELLLRAGELRPEIILTDMRMPGVNGEELIRALRAQNKHVKLLVLSGFDEFSLVHQALKSKAVDYLLKPVDAEELNDGLRKAAEQYELERSSLAAAYARRRGEYLDMFLQNGEDDRQIFLRESGIKPVAGERFCAALLRAYRPDGRPFPEKFEYLRTAMTGGLGEHGCVCAGKTRDGSLVAVMSFPAGGAAEFLEALSVNYRTDEELRLLIAAGAEYEDHRKLRDSYREAVAALYAMPISHAGGPAYYADMMDGPVVPADYGQTEYLLRAAAESGNAAQFSAGLKEFYHGLAEAGTVSIAYLRQCNNRMARLLGLLLPDGGRQWRKRLHELESELGQVIDPATSFELLQQCVDEMCPSPILLRGEKKAAAYKIREYLQAHYCEKVSLQDLANHLYLTKEYVSKLFKQEFSIGIFDYIDFLRIERAKELLRAGRTVREVTEEVGYYDESHLNRKFKKYVGVVPRDYKC